MIGTKRYLEVLRYTLETQFTSRQTAKRLIKCYNEIWASTCGAMMQSTRRKTIISKYAKQRIGDKLLTI